MLQRLLMVVSIGAALAVLVVLVMRTQSEPQALERHMARMMALAQLRVADTEADIQAARARLSLAADTDGLADSARRIETARKGLVAHRDELRGVSRDLAGIVSALMQQLDEKQALLESHGAQLGQFATAYAQFLRLGEELLAHPSLPASHPLHGAVRSLIEEATAYSLQSLPANQDVIERLLTTISIDAGSVPALRARLLAFGRATTGVLGERDKLMGLAGRLAAVPVAGTLERLQQRYTGYYVQAENELARYRLVLAIYASALLVVFGFVGWRLRRSYGELQGLNAGLEETVESRTAELRKALDNLRLQQAQLIQSEKMAALGQMVAGVAHEINTPLGYVRGNVETVRDTLPLIRELFDAEKSGDSVRLQQAERSWPPDEGLAEMEMLLNDADYGLGQIRELVLGLKDFSRVDRSLTELFDLNEGLDTALKICQSQLKGRVEVERNYGVLPAVPCAPSQINQVFLNLLSNAGQAIEGSGSIAIRTGVEDNHAIVEIRDSGCGMDAGTLKHIFEPFFTTKPVGQGTGLGLSIVFRIVEDHGGRIDVDSAPGQGTIFRVRLPLQRKPASPANAASTAGADALQETHA
jgi:two-component system, NtrC family, sensor kinase